MQQPLKQHSFKNYLLVALTIQMHFIHVIKIFFAQEFLVDSPVSQAPESRFESPIAPWKSKKIKTALGHLEWDQERQFVGKKPDQENLMRLSL